MPEIKVLSRSVGDRKGYHRNFSPHEHRFSRAREYVRAVRAAKLERLHAKPFVAAFDGHSETVCKLIKVRNKLPIIVSADWDGEIRCWDMAQRLLNWRVIGHKGRTMGLTTTNNTNGNSNLVISTGIDKTIKLWKLNVQGTARKISVRDDATGWEGINTNQNKESGSNSDQIPISTIHHWEPFHCVDACYEENSTLYATGSTHVKLWDINRSHELHTFKGTVDQVSCMSFNPSQHNILSVGMQDRKITFYDTRTKNSLPYITMLNWANEIRFNPIDPRLFVVASNDNCLYTFDMRNIRSALRTHRGHIDCVMSVDWNPIGTEFVSGSIDGHIRIWESKHESNPRFSRGKQIGYSRELYKGRRMYNLYQVRWSYDNKYILSGSADGAIRLWKSSRSMPLNKINKRQKTALQYNLRLKEKYAHMSEVGTIWKFRKAKLPHRIPRNGIYYKTERTEQKKYKELKNKMKIYNNKQSTYKNEWNTQRRARKKLQFKSKQNNRSWAKKVVQHSGMIHENSS